MRFRSLLPVALAAALAGPAVWAAPAEAPRRLFGPDAAAVAPHAAPVAGANRFGADVRERHVRAARDLLPALAASAAARPRFMVDLFPGLSLEAEVVASEPTAGGGVAVVARLAAIEHGSAVLVQNGEVIEGSVIFPGGTFSVSTRADGTQTIAQVATHLLPPEKNPVEVPGAAPLTADSAPTAEVDPPADSGRLIDVMVVYTPAARTAMGGTAQIEARIDLGIAETNTAYRNSGVAQRLRLVHAQEVAYVEANNLGLDLDRVTNAGDGVMDEVHALRNSHGADLVKLVVAGSDACGIAWLPGSISAANAGYGFSVTHYSCISPNLTFGHELGHNMGVRHDPYVDGASGPLPYNHGFVDLVNRWRTIMAYNDACSAAPPNTSCTRLALFSNPKFAFDGDGAGTKPAAVMGSAALENNALALNRTAKAVAAYRATSALHPVAQRFTDVPLAHPFFGHVEFLAQAGITSGCATGQYCPDASITRRQMAVFLERGIRSSIWAPPVSATPVFADLPLGATFREHAEALYGDTVTTGCAANPLRYCPDNAVSRGEMAVFLLRSRCGGAYVPAAATGTVFADVAASHPFARYIEKLYALGITGGCAAGPLRYCPDAAVSRSQMAAFFERSYPFATPSETCAP